MAMAALLLTLLSLIINPNDNLIIIIISVGSLKKKRVPEKTPSALLTVTKSLCRAQQTVENS